MTIGTILLIVLILILLGVIPFGTRRAGVTLRAASSESS